MRVVVPDGSYFVGRSIVEQCLERDLQVTVFNRGTKAMPGVRQLVRDHGVRLERTLASAPLDVLVEASVAEAVVAGRASGTGGGGE